MPEPQPPVDPDDPGFEDHPESDDAPIDSDAPDGPGDPNAGVSSEDVPPPTALADAGPDRPDDGDRSDLVDRLRRRAEELRASADRPRLQRPDSSLAEGLSRPAPRVDRQGYPAPPRRSPSSSSVPTSPLEAEPPGVDEVESTEAARVDDSGADAAEAESTEAELPDVDEVESTEAARVDDPEAEPAESPDVDDTEPAPTEPTHVDDTEHTNRSGALAGDQPITGHDTLPDRTTAETSAPAARLGQDDRGEPHEPGDDEVDEPDDPSATAAPDETDDDAGEPHEPDDPSATAAPDETDDDAGEPHEPDDPSATAAPDETDDDAGEPHETDESDDPSATAAPHETDDDAGKPHETDESDDPSATAAPDEPDDHDDGSDASDESATVPSSPPLPATTDRRRPRRRRNRSVLWVLLALGVIAGAVAAAFVLTGGDDDAPDPSALDNDPRTVATRDVPTIEDIVGDIELPDGPPGGLVVADTGVSVLDDRFDDDRQEATYAAVITNPSDRWLAHGLAVTFLLKDGQGRVVAEDETFVEIVLPGQTVAVAGLLFEAPPERIERVDVRLEVSRWRESSPADASAFTVSDIETVPAEFGGLRTTATLRSDFDRTLSDVAVTAVYRHSDGAILGGYNAFVERIEPGEEVSVTIAQVANLDPDDVVTELYPTAGFDFVQSG